MNSSPLLRKTCSDALSSDQDAGPGAADLTPRRLPALRWKIAPRTLIIWVTAGSLISAFTVGAFWFFTTSGASRFEPAMGGLGLLAGITGVVAERWAAAQESRDQALRAVRDELEVNRSILNSSPFADVVDPIPRRNVYPRLHLSAVDTALSSAALSPRRDKTLLDLLHGWRDEAGMFNHQLSLAEILAFTVGSDEVLRDLHEGLHSADGPLENIRAKIAGLLAHLVTSG